MLSLLEDIDSLEACSTGVFVLGEGERPLGVVFVQHARVCWAVSSKMRGRLTDLLVRASGGSIDRLTLERTYRECRAAHTPLGDTLVRKGLVSASSMREALLAHTCEALLSCARSGGAAWRWSAHTESSYDAANTFAAAEVLTGLAAVQRPSVRDSAQAAFERHLPPTARGIAFVRESAATPIVLRACTLSAAELINLGQWAASTVDIAGALSPGGVVVLKDGSDSIVIWQSESLLHLAFCADPSDAAFVVATHARPKRG